MAYSHRTFNCKPTKEVRMRGDAVGTAVGAAGATVAGAPPSILLRGEERASAHGAARLQPSLPLVRGPGHGRSGVGCHDLHQEPRAALVGRSRSAVFGGDRGGSTKPRAHLGRALQRRRHHGTGVGGPEEFQEEGWSSGGWFGRRTGAGFPGGKAVERDASIDDGSAGPFVPQG